MKKMVMISILCAILLCGCGQDIETSNNVSESTTTTENVTTTTETDSTTTGADSKTKITTSTTTKAISTTTKAASTTGENTNTEASVDTAATDETVTDETPISEKKGAETGLPESAVGEYSSRSGIIVLYADGMGTISFQDTVPIRWNSSELISDGFIYPYTISGDTITVNVDGMEMSFTKGGEAPRSDINPIINNVGTYAGTYPNDRAIMQVEASGDDRASITISWAGSALIKELWTMSGECIVNGDIISISYTDSTCRMVEYDTDGNVVTDKTEYTNGTGTLTFSGNTVKWNDNSENVDDVMLFEYIY